MTTFGLYGARLSLAVWRHFTCYIFFVFTYYVVLSLKNKYTILYYTILYYTILYYTILYYTILYYTILYYTILYYTILYYTILYYTILYYTILYYTILYYTIRSPAAHTAIGLFAWLRYHERLENIDGKSHRRKTCD